MKVQIEIELCWPGGRFGIKLSLIYDGEV